MDYLCYFLSSELVSCCVIYIPNLFALIARTAFVGGSLSFLIIHARALLFRILVPFALYKFAIERVTACISKLILRARLLLGGHVFIFYCFLDEFCKYRPSYQLYERVGYVVYMVWEAIFGEVCRFYFVDSYTAALYIC